MNLFFSPPKRVHNFEGNVVKYMFSWETYLAIVNDESSQTRLSRTKLYS